MTPFELAVDALATYRLTRLATEDVITQPLRDRLIRAVYQAHPDQDPWGVDTGAHTGWHEDRPLPTVEEEGSWQDYAMDDPHPPKLATLLTCRWCAGVWVAAGVVTLRRVGGRRWEPMAELLACASAAALVAGLED